MAEPLHLLDLAVAPEWIDYNGHMNMAYYLVAFDKSVDVLFDKLGLGQSYRRETDHSMYMLESHLTYAREAKLGDKLAISARLIDADEKRLHLFQRIQLGDRGADVATMEGMVLHVALAGPKSAPFPAAARAKIETLLTAHQTLPIPHEVGRKVGLKQK